MASFYIKQRKRLNILISSNGKPVGGRWSFDTENRKRLPKNLEDFFVPKERSNRFIVEARKYIEKNFNLNYGDHDSFFYPVTFDESKKWLENFIENRLCLFGDYQDAIKSDEHFLFHSILTRC